MTKGYEKMAAELLQNNSAGYDPEQTIKLMMLDKLDRIAEALEGIDSSLRDMQINLEALDENISDCIYRDAEEAGFAYVRGEIVTR